MQATEYSSLIDSRVVFHLVGEVADSMGRECYVVGGYVRDLIIHRHSKDIDFVTIGAGIEVAQAVAARLGNKSHLAVYRNFGTAQIHCGDDELEFVGARRESYDRQSRKPVVEDGTLDDDLARRDFTINAMAICVNAGRFGELVDRYDGLGRHLQAHHTHAARPRHNIQRRPATDDARNPVRHPAGIRHLSRDP